LFTHKFFDFKELETKTINGKRHYHVNGDYYPSVTTVLSGESKPALDAWRKRVGDAKADQISRAATNRGTGMHTLLEAYVLNQDMTAPMKAAMPTHIELFNQLKPLIDDNIGTIYGIEAPLYSNKLGVAGRADFIADWKGSPAIIDFKSSTRRKVEKYMKGYYMQEALYSAMMYEMFGFFIPKIVTLVATEETGHPDVFEQRAAEHMPAAIELVAQFYEKAAADVSKL
jgi:hypothetical protein